MNFKLWLETNINGFNFVKPLRAEIVVMGDVAKVENSFRKDTGYYVNKGGTSGKAGSYEEFQKFLQKGTPIEMPEVSVFKGEINFINGRHRFAVFRDMGFTKLPFAMHREEEHNFKEIFGA